MSQNIKSFTQLIAWKKTHLLVLRIYQIVRNYPSKEIYGLNSQMRRASISISSNIAEGFSRKTTKDKKHFYYIALGSITELQNQLLISRDLHYVKNDVFKDIALLTFEVAKLINGLLNTFRRFCLLASRLKPLLQHPLCICYFS